MFICVYGPLYSTVVRETGADWDKELAEDVKGECETKYGRVLAIKVERESQVCVLPVFSAFKANAIQGEIYVKFDSIANAKEAIDSLNGRWFGGKQISAGFISDAIMQAHR